MHKLCLIRNFVSIVTISFLVHNFSFAHSGKTNSEGCHNDTKNKIFSLQDEVSSILSIDNDVDKFLDNSTILDEWEEIIPDAEYGIFVMAILNNVKRDSIIDKILDSILNTDESNFKASAIENNNIKQHPFC